jgi:hypothetical protein
MVLHSKSYETKPIYSLLLNEEALLFRSGLVPRNFLRFHGSSGKDSEESGETEELTAYIPRQLAARYIIAHHVLHKPTAKSQ